ncbi:TetR/AcrR family transcriptional regulator [Kutzneria kofuensis]|uniref:TetR/AcrR family transcriptional repressor of nem operon n=1 Tax=Kutzneria kofuensis TaxID=103725 RepID=A0A7W9KPM8_9PSEU|nr:TetR/AcrR family transcriptional regulator [Kutzneria kofuensis]MBB5896428.1 TetR/AcrR family transcriptional repressor of nem operon [Kutzneria kofuensis]
MRYPKDHKEQARATILKSGARALKEKGFTGVGVDGLAAAAQVTSGALYSNFGSKESFFEQVVKAQLGAEFAAIDDPDPEERRRRLRELLRFYLSDEHCEAVADGCLMAAVSVDVARAGDSIRETYEGRMADVVALVAPAMPGPPEAQQESAWAVVAAIVGAVTIARALPPGERSRAVLDATLHSVMAILGEDTTA